MAETTDAETMPTERPEEVPGGSPGTVVPANSSVPEEVGGVPGLPPDWPQQATTRVVDLVDNVRSKSAGPAIRVSRGVVYGLVALILALVALPLLLVGLTRGLISLVDLATTHERAVWISFCGIGVIFTLLGLILWSRRPKGAARA